MRLREHSPVTAPLSRAEANRRNAQHSTGPRTAEGKARSCQNGFKHGLYSTQLVLPNECAAAFDELRAALRAEHQPINTTEEILVDELAQHFWRLRRFRTFEADGWQPGSDWFTDRMLALITRSLASAERSFYRALAALTKLQKARGFVPSKQPAAAPAPLHDFEFIAKDDPAYAEQVRLYKPDVGFVPEKTPLHSPSEPPVLSKTQSAPEPPSEETRCRSGN